METILDAVVRSLWAMWFPMALILTRRTTLPAPQEACTGCAALSKYTPNSGKRIIMQPLRPHRARPRAGQPRYSLAMHRYHFPLTLGPASEGAAFSDPPTLILFWRTLDFPTLPQRARSAARNWSSNAFVWALRSICGKWPVFSMISMRMDGTRIRSISR